MKRYYFFAAAGAGHFTIFLSTVTSSPGFLPLQAMATASSFFYAISSAANAIGVRVAAAKVTASIVVRSLLIMNVFPLGG